MAVGVVAPVRMKSLWDVWTMIGLASLMRTRTGMATDCATLSWTAMSPKCSRIPMILDGLMELSTGVTAILEGSRSLVVVVCVVALVVERPWDGVVDLLCGLEHPSMISFGPLAVSCLPWTWEALCQSL